MPRSTWLNILIFLLVLIAAAYLAQLLLSVLSGFSDIILILTLAWLVAYALGPLVENLYERRLPTTLVNAASELYPALGKRLADFQVTRPLAVSTVYLGLAILVVVVIASFIPTILAQVNAIVPELSSGGVLQVAIAQAFAAILNRLNLAVSVQDLLYNAFQSLQAYATPILQNTVAILTSVLSLLGNALLVILLSFFFALDGPRFSRMLFDVIPGRLHQETRMFLVTTDRAFGNYLRAQILQAVIIGLGTGAVLAVLGIQAALLSSLFSALFMLIPLVGPILALIPPLFAALLTDPSRVLLVMIPLIILQVIVQNVLMPRVMGNALGLHPLVIIVSLLIGIKLAGFWGAFFAMPLAGIISAFGAFLIRRRQRLTELTSAIVQQDDDESADADTSQELEAVLAEPTAPAAGKKKESHPRLS